MKTKLFLVLLLSVLSTAASAQTAKQSAMTKFIAKLTYAESRCKSLQANTPALGVIAGANGVALEDLQPGGKFRRLLEAQLAVLKAEHDSSSDEIFCAAAYAAYGPDGVVTPGAIERK